MKTIFTLVLLFVLCGFDPAVFSSIFGSSATGQTIGAHSISALFFALSLFYAHSLFRRDRDGPGR